eukprot:gene10986-22950_t
MPINEGRPRSFEISINDDSPRRPPPRLSSSASSSARKSLPSNDNESNITPSSSKPPSRFTFGSSTKEFTVGQRVRVKRPVGKPGYEEGVIMKNNRDNTYDVEYDNGTMERAVKSLRITANKPMADESPRSEGEESKSRSKSRGGGDTDDESDVDRKPGVGDKVEAKFKGGAK